MSTIFFSQFSIPGAKCDFKSNGYLGFLINAAFRELFAFLGILHAQCGFI